MHNVQKKKKKEYKASNVAYSLQSLLDKTSFYLNVPVPLLAPIKMSIRRKIHTLIISSFFHVGHEVETVENYWRYISIVGNENQVWRERVRSKTKAVSFTWTPYGRSSNGLLGKQR